MKYILAIGMIVFFSNGHTAFKRVCSLECYEVEPLSEYQSCMKRCTESEQREEALEEVTGKHSNAAKKTKKIRKTN